MITRTRVLIASLVGFVCTTTIGAALLSPAAGLITFGVTCAISGVLTAVLFEDETSPPEDEVPEELGFFS